MSTIRHLVPNTWYIPGTYSTHIASVLYCTTRKPWYLVGFTAYTTPPPLASRFTVDDSARFVPVSIAENHMHSHNLSLDDYREIPSPAKVPRGMAPFVDMAGRLRGPAAPLRGENWRDDGANSISHAVNRRGPLLSGVTPGLPTSGKANAKRAGGKLGPITITSTPSIKRRPVRRCEFARVGTLTAVVFRSIGE